MPVFFFFFLRNHVKCVSNPQHVCITWGDLLTLLDAEFRTFYKAILLNDVMRDLTAFLII